MKLSVQELCFSYEPGCPVLSGLSCDAQDGELLAVLGANGAGKTTLFRCLMGAQTGYTGEILVDGTPLSQLSPRQRARRIAYIPQTHRPTFGYTVLETALMGTTRQLGAFAQPRQAQIDTAMAALEQVGMADKAQRNAAHLRGGEFQLVLIARAMAQQAQVLVMDEPTSALDYGNQLRILSQVQQLCRDGYAVLLSTHDPQHALRFSHRVLALDHGHAAAFGDTAKVLTPALLHRLYGVAVDFVSAAGQTVIVPGLGGEA